MKTVLKTLAICAMAGGMVAQSVYAEPLVIQEQGSFSAGGTIITAPGNLTRKRRWTLRVKPGMAIMRLCSTKFRKIRINTLSSCCTAQVSSPALETTPDGREGFQNIFLRRGFSTYLVDQPRRAAPGARR